MFQAQSIEMKIPDFLVPVTGQPDSSSVVSTSNTPSWLQPLPEFPPFSEVDEKTLKQLQKQRKQILQELEDVENAQIFENVLTQLSEGIPLSTLLRKDMRGISTASFMRWIHRDPRRIARYHEAQSIGCEVIASEIIDIADGTDSLEDVNRSRLRIDTRRYLMGVWNKKRYGETKQIEVAGTISITDALAAAQARVIDAEVIRIDRDENEGEDE